MTNHFQATLRISTWAISGVPTTMSVRYFDMRLKAHNNSRWIFRLSPLGDDPMSVFSFGWMRGRRLAYDYDGSFRLVFFSLFCFSFSFGGRSGCTFAGRARRQTGRNWRVFFFAVWTYSILCGIIHRRPKRETPASRRNRGREASPARFSSLSDTPLPWNLGEAAEW